MDDEVACTAGALYPEEPRAFTWLGRRLKVKNISARSRTPRGRSFIVLASDDKTYELFYSEGRDAWRITPREDFNAASR